MSQPELSVIVPLHDEQETVRPLVTAVREALAATVWELILVDDGSRDATAQRAEELVREDPRIRLLRLMRNYGQTAAMQAGFDHARGQILVSMDGDLQNDPGDIPYLIETMRKEGCDLVAGYRVRRQDRLLSRKVPSWVANRLIRWITGVKIRDNGCSLKAYRRELIVRMRLYSEMHRFIPAVAAATAGASIMEVPVRHHPRRYGRSKYGIGRIFRVAADLITITMIRSFRNRPLRLFGSSAGVASVLGVLFLAGFVAQSVTAGAYDREALVFPAAALLSFGLASYLVMLGLIGEAAVAESNRTRRELPFLVREEVREQASGSLSAHALNG